MGLNEFEEGASSLQSLQNEKCPLNAEGESFYWVSMPLLTGSLQRGFNGRHKPLFPLLWSCPVKSRTAETPTRLETFRNTVQLTRDLVPLIPPGPQALNVALPTAGRSSEHLCARPPVSLPATHVAFRPRSPQLPWQPGTPRARTATPNHLPSSSAPWETPCWRGKPLPSRSHAPCSAFPRPRLGVSRAKKVQKCCWPHAVELGSCAAAASGLKGRVVARQTETYCLLLMASQS